MKPCGIIYKATNKINGKCYIGQTIQGLNRRMSEHKYKSKYSTLHFYSAIRKYKFENFVWEIICKCVSKIDLDIKEVYYIQLFGSYESGYNSSLGGDYNAMYNKKHSEETKNKIRKNRRSVKGENNPRFGDHRSYEDIHGKDKATELKLGVSTFHKGKPKSKDWRKNASIRFSGKNNPMYGKVGHLSTSSKKYLVMDPEGATTVVLGLAEFCRVNNLNVKNMYRLANKKLSFYKGWSCTHY